VSGRLGVGAKSWDGSGLVANLAAATALLQLGVLPAPAVDWLEPFLRPPVLGGGEPVGHFEPVFELETT
jgi:hypothetical protein